MIEENTRAQEYIDDLFEYSYGHLHGKQMN